MNKGFRLVSDLCTVLNILYSTITSPIDISLVSERQRSEQEKHRSEYRRDAEETQLRP
jgi:hypothetical protein